MLIRRSNWPVVFAVAVLGPLVGAFVATQLWTGICPESDRFSADRLPERQASQSGDTEDEFHLPDGDRIALDEIAPGRTVAIVVMKAPWCPVCQRQLKRLSQRRAAIQRTGATVVGLTTAESAQNRELVEELELGFPVLGEPSKDFHRRLGLWREGGCHAIPGVVFLNESGDIVDVHRGRYPGKPQDAFILDTLRALTD